MAEEYDLAAIRSLLDAAFNPGEIRTLAFDLFQSVYRDFAPGMDRRQMIEAIVDYANRHGRILELLDYVKHRNSYQYGRYANRLMEVPQIINQEPRDITSYLLTQYDFHLHEQLDESVTDFRYREEPQSDVGRLEYEENDLYSDTYYTDSDRGARFKALLVAVIVIVVGYGIYNVFFAGKLTIRAIVVDPTAPVLYTTTNRGVLKLNTETASLEGFIKPPQTTLKSSQAIMTIGNGSFSSFYVAENSQIYKTEDGGITWANPISIGNLESVFSFANTAIQPNSGYTFFAGTSRGVYRSTNGEDWESANVGLPLSYFSDLKLVVHPYAPGTLYALTGNQIYYTEDSGTSWDELILPQEFQDNRYFERVLELTVDTTANSGLLYLGTNRGLYKREVEGQKWVRVRETADLSYYSIITVRAEQVDILYVGTTDGILKSTDGGKNWFSQVSLEGKEVRVLVASPRNSVQLFAVTGDGQIYASNDSGDTWRLIFSRL